jgi:hypothetical protein
VMGLDPIALASIPKRCLPPEIQKELGPLVWTKEETIAANEYRTEKALQDSIYVWINSQPDCDCRGSRIDKKATVRPGTPDFFCTIDGMALYIECKLPGRKPSPAQEREIAHLRSRKGRVIVVTSLQEVQKEVRNMQAEMRYVRATLRRHKWNVKY